MPPQTIEDFVDQLIAKKDFPDLTPDVKKELKRDLLQRIDSFINARLVAALSDQDVLAFEQLLKDGKSDSEIQQFMQEKIPDLTSLLTQILLEFKGIYLGTTPVPPTSI
jgi:hypothetical protein